MKLLSTNPVEFCLKKHKMFCTKCNFQSEQTFETPCMAGWVKGKEKFQESFEILFLGGGGGGGGGATFGTLRYISTQP